MRFFITILFSFAIVQVNAQTIIVKDKDSSNPLELVTITSNNPKISVVTNDQGEADVSGFKQSDIIEVRMIGYTTQYFQFADFEKINYTILLTPSSFSIDQIVVSATRWNQTSREVPLKIISISRSDISLQNPQTAADLLGISGEVFIQKSQQGGGSPMIRGFATNRLLIAVDGVRMNNAIFRSGNLQNVISLDPFATEKTEVLFGPGSVIYGSDAIGGVMNFYSLSPKFSSENKPLITGNFTTRYSSANREKTGHLDINFGWEKWAMLTSFSTYNYGNVIMGSHGPNEYLRNEFVKREGNTDIVVNNPNPRTQRPTGYSQTNLMQKISFKPNKQWDINYGLHHSATTSYDRYDRLIYYRNGLPRSAEWYYGPQIWIMNNFSINNIAEKTLYDQLTISTAHQFFQESRNDRNFNANTLKTRIERVNAYSINFDLKKSIDFKQKIFYGAEAIYNDVNSRGTDKDISSGISVEGPSRYPQSKWSSYALYLTYQRKISEIINLQAGGRYNRFLLDAKFDNTFYPFPFTNANINKGALTGSLGLSINPSRQWRITANLSTGFRSPNVDDLGKVFDSEPGSVVVPNPDLNAEYAYNGEISVTKIFGDRLEIDFSTYYTLLDQAMVKRNATLNGQDSIIYDGELSKVQSIQNAAYAKVWGFQTDFEFKISHRFTISSRFSYQKGIEELDNGTTSPLRHATPWFGITHITYTAKKIKFDFYSNYSGEISFNNLADEERGKPYIYAIDKNGNPYSPGWYTLNFKTIYELNKSFTISGNIENITNQRYRPYSSGMVAPGINFIVAVKLVF
ncbi:MAG: TonB-dependent receptor [Tenuifilaceae bacterium]